MVAAWQRIGEKRKKNDRSVFEEERMTARLDEEGVRVSYFCTYILFIYIHIIHNYKTRSYIIILLVTFFNLI